MPNNIDEKITFRQSIRVGWMNLQLYILFVLVLVLAEFYLGLSRFIWSASWALPATICPLYGCGGIPSSQYGYTYWATFDFWVLNWGLITTVALVVAPLLMMSRTEYLTFEYITGFAWLIGIVFGCIELVRWAFMWGVALFNCSWWFVCGAYGWAWNSPFFVVLIATSVRILLILNLFVDMFTICMCVRSQHNYKERNVIQYGLG